MSALMEPLDTSRAERVHYLAQQNQCDDPGPHFKNRVLGLVGGF
jgi:hypothetical protein